MVAACEDCLNGTLLLDLRKKSGIKCLTPRVVSLCAMNRLGVYEIHVFLQSSVHEGYSVPPILVVFWDGFTFFSEPVNSIPSDAVIATHTHAVESSCAEHIDSQTGVLISTIAARDLQVIGKWVCELAAFPLVLIVLGHVVLSLIVQSFEFFVAASTFKVSWAWDPNERDLVLIQRMCQLFVILLEATIAVEEATADDITGDYNKVWFLF